MKYQALVAFLALALPFSAQASVAKELKCDLGYRVSAEGEAEIASQTKALDQEEKGAAYAVAEFKTADARFSVRAEGYVTGANFFDDVTGQVSNVYIYVTDNTTKAIYVAGNPYVFQVKKDVLRARADVSLSEVYGVYPRLEVNCELN